MKARLHNQLAYITYRVTLRRMAERHYFAGMNFPAANDDGIL